MRLSRVLASIAVVTLASLVYVHQQVELVKLSYRINIREKKIQEMLDQRERLSYNIKNLESPLRLEKVLLAKKIDVSFPKRAQVVELKSSRAAVAREDRLRAAGIEKRPGIFGIFEFLIPRAEARELVKDR